MITDSPHRYLRAGLQAGVDRVVIERALAEARQVESVGLTSVLTLKRLAWQTGASYIYLRETVQRKIDPYSDILRHRRNGAEMRRISAPNPPLMAVQRWILRRIVQGLPVHHSSYAYMPGNSIVSCASRHVGASWLIKMDIHDFFHSIDERQVYDLFWEAGYNKLISFELARICTRGGLGPLINQSYLSRQVISSYRSRRLGVLPQGAPTSGALANVVMYGCDEQLDALARAHNLIYTRYADDIVFSAREDLTRHRATEVIQAAEGILRRHDFKPHRKKTKICPPGSRRIVLGLLVDGTSVRLPKQTCQRIEGHIRGVEHFGLGAHVGHRKFASTFGFVHHMNGLLAFAYGVNPEYAEKRCREWAEVLRGQEWPIPAMGRNQSR